METDLYRNYVKDLFVIFDSLTKSNIMMQKVYTKWCNEMDGDVSELN